MRRCRVGLVGVCLLVALFSFVFISETLAQTLPSPWLTQDIGSPSPAGNATYSNQHFSIAGSGSDIWGTSDQFRFVYQPVSGDVEIIARINSFAAVDPWSKVGVMVRNDLTSSSANAFSMLSGANGIQFQSRPKAGADSATTAGPLVSAPQWVRLRRVGSTVTAYAGADGETWQPVGSTTIALNGTVYVGLAISSHNPGSLASAVLSNVTVSPFGLPSGQSTSDIGSPAITGSTSYSGGTYTMSAAGADIWGSSDQFRYVYRQISGDVDVIARVNSLQYMNAWAKAGVMVRETLDANARHAMALMTAGAGYSFQWRLDPGGLAANSPGGNGVAPAWVRLKRSGYQFEAFRSADGISWTSMGVQVVPMADTVYVGLAVTSHDATVATNAVIDQLTIASASTTTTATTTTTTTTTGRTAAATTSTSTTNRSPKKNQPPTVTLTSPTSGASFTAPATITLSADASDPEGRLSRVEFYVGSTLVATDTTSPFSTTWSTSTAGWYAIKAIAYDANGGVTTSATSTVTVTSVTSSSSSLPAGQAARDIGSPAIAGSTSYSSGVYTITAGGVDIWGTSDQFRFVYQQVAGDVDVVARVNSMTFANSWSKAGVMVRETLDANARHAMMMITAGAGYSFQWRLAPGGYAASTSGGSGAAPAWVRLKRTGSQFEAFRSADGSSWTSIGVQSVPMATAVYVGLAVTSHNTSATTTAVIDRLKIASTSTTTNQPPSITLTSPASGTSYTAPATVTLSASASDPEGRLSRVEFYVGSTLVATDTSSPFSASWSTSTAGSYAIKAIAYDADGGVTTSATSTITVTSTTSTVPTTVIFQASADHYTLVTSYRLDVFANGADPTRSTPIASSNLGKPTPDANNDITVDRATFFSALAPATYEATVSAIDSAGESRSAAITFVR